ncbi:MAG: Type 1 glutamine amidotransferase-like domain-containing protein [Fimbriimonas sp.]|nr:Type 1 glutamine amidotransferase-like domain-containing protein [Fimbriimonas sp.]
MKLLLTSSGISNPSIHGALVDLLGKPIAESTALCIPTAIYPFRGGPAGAYRFISGTASSPLCELGWKSLGVLELTALPSVDRENWIPAVEETDALLVWGGDVLYLRHWMQESGLAHLFDSVRPELVYVGVSAGSMVTGSTIGETYTNSLPPRADDITSESVLVDTPQGELSVNFTMAPGMGLVDFALLPHVGHERFPENSLPNAEIWASKLPAPMYAIDDQTAIKVVDEAVEVVSEGHWKLFTPNS